VGDFQAREGNDYYSAGSLASGMELYNQTLLQVCRDRGVACIDLAAALPKDTTIFYDDAHFNEAGSRRVAEVLAHYLITQSTLGALLGAPRQTAHRRSGPPDKP